MIIGEYTAKTIVCSSCKTIVFRIVVPINGQNRCSEMILQMQAIFHVPKN